MEALNMPTFFFCPECGLYYNDDDWEPSKGLTLEEVVERYGRNGWKQNPDQWCDCGNQL